MTSARPRSHPLIPLFSLFPPTPTLLHYSALQGKRNEREGSRRRDEERIRSAGEKEAKRYGENERERECKEREREAGVVVGLTDSLQVYSDIRKEQRVPVFILLTGTIIRPFAPFFLSFSLPRYALSSSLSLSPSLFPSNLPELSQRRGHFKTLRLIY